MGFRHPRTRPERLWTSHHTRSRRRNRLSPRRRIRRPPLTFFVTCWAATLDDEGRSRCDGSSDIDGLPDDVSHAQAGLRLAIEHVRRNLLTGSPVHARTFEVDSPRRVTLRSINGCLGVEPLRLSCAEPIPHAGFAEDRSRVLAGKRLLIARGSPSDQLRGCVDHSRAIGTPQRAIDRASRQAKEGNTRNGQRGQATRNLHPITVPRPIAPTPARPREHRTAPQWRRRPRVRDAGHASRRPH